MKKSLFVLSAILLVALLAGITSLWAAHLPASWTAVTFTEPQYAKTFTGFRSLSGDSDTCIAAAVDTFVINIHTCYENYFLPYDSVTHEGHPYDRIKTVWCLAAYADAVNDSVEWIFSYASSYDSLHWVFYPLDVGDTLNVSNDSLVLFPVPKDADLMQWFRIIRTGGGDNHPGLSIGELLLLWQLRGPKIGNEVGLQD